ncbi:hypothetical protein E4U09_000279 [Claviceps aff. purpurea]|uniref:Uncharacterized protein n=1 Tax=Claviceps aff. purpurea TaxID=1967640 RepID=A0A9P7U2F9_9HYPO|nr:hypothetical protein E4U51_006591 [Claviceps purpurea]KAG6283342.1 hypothetical protein E4U09_000279 [Claviceps aff. purpurea]
MPDSHAQVWMELVDFASTTRDEMVGDSNTVHSNQELSIALDYSLFDALWRGGGRGQESRESLPATSNIVEPEQSPPGTRSSFDAAKGNRAGQPSSRNIIFSRLGNVSGLRVRIGVTPEA